MCGAAWGLQLWCWWPPTPLSVLSCSSALVFTRLPEFDSTNVSEGAQPPGKPYPLCSLAKFSWNNITNSLDLATLSIIFQGRPVDDPTGAFANGSLTFKVQAFSRSGRPDLAPSPPAHSRCLPVRSGLIGASPRGNHSLFGLEVATLGQGPDCPSVNEQNSIDDEYAPAVLQRDRTLWAPCLWLERLLHTVRSFLHCWRHYLLLLWESAQ
uniref:Glycosylated lysosomal membrane protein n=1 Tax=Mus spicilegus TaxID=10103 RepID=A0A8C6N2N8_MUSSI